MDIKNVIAESGKKMGYMGNKANKELETSPSNDPKCNPSFEELGNKEKMGYKIEKSNGGDEGNKVGSTAGSEPVEESNGHKAVPPVISIPEVLVNKISKHNSPPLTLKVGDRVEYAGTDVSLQRQYAGVLILDKIDLVEGYACLTPDGKSLTCWLQADELRSR